MEDILFTESDVTSTYKQIHDLLVTKYIIEQYSTNQDDIREIAVKGMDLSKVKKVLELGCGYGFFIEKLQGLLHKSAVIQGIDLVENNRDVYLNSISSIGYHGEFIHGDVNIIESFDDSSYDFIIACYSLYFFPHLIKDIARILKPNGIFIAITHSRFSLQEIIKIVPLCMKKIGLPSISTLRLNKLFAGFSSENGSSRLRQYFIDCDSIFFKNALLFQKDHIDDCIYYIEKKRHLIYKEILDEYPDKVVDLESCLSQMLYEQVKSNNNVIITKDDTIFKCWKPR